MTFRVFFKILEYLSIPSTHNEKRLKHMKLKYKLLLVGQYIYR